MAELRALLLVNADDGAPDGGGEGGGGEGAPNDGGGEGGGGDGALFGDGAPDGGGEGGGGCAHVVHAPGGPLPAHEFPECLQNFAFQAVAPMNMLGELDSLFVFQPVMSMSK